MSDHWKALRAQNIGGSEIAALFGCSPYLTFYKLWHIKRNFLAEDDLDSNERVMAGKFMEAGAIQWANHKFDSNFVQPFEYIRHRETKGMGCTPDALDRAAGIMAQIKIVDGLQFHREWEADGHEIKKAPLHILLQCQHELECAELDESHLIVVAGGNRLYRMIQPRDREIGQMAREAVAKFWAMDEAPDPDFQRDAESIHALRKNLPVKEFQDLSDDIYLYKIIRQAMKATVQKNKIQDSLNVATAEIVHLIGGAENTRCKNMVIRLPAGRKTPQYISERETL